MSGQGRFLSFEGIDGSGKSTQARRLAEYLKSAGHDVVFTREPGGSAGAEDIRKLVLEGDADRWSPATELLLFTAARRDHLERLILPALDAGQIVISDRYVDSTRIYQGVSRGDLRRQVDQLHELMIGREADLTILIDMDPKIGLSRAFARQGGEERFETMGQDMHQKMREGFLDLAAQAPERIKVIDGARTVDEVAEDVRAVVDAFLS
ncbi:Thymidylate kinase [Roseovarius albus]|uniref:Thymidylate kinase n=1 Tax=Roseovarius albus TaxID=1247867 RepID=A0A1X6Z9V7_9RHOB|nr:dTMP kinase [Roseovarius albus]SLN45261.1 Thymidylate kinase [Roseovarius albus]